MRTLGWLGLLVVITVAVLWIVPLELAIAALILLPVVDWLAVAVITALLRHYPSVHALRERRALAAAIAALTSLFAVLALARFGHIELPGELVGRLIVLAVCGLSAINAVFLWQYRHALFGRVRDVPVDRLHHEDEEP